MKEEALYTMKEIELAGPCRGAESAWALPPIGGTPWQR